ncbi:MAG: TraR/DksA C4-type zinc finger protein [Cyclobacteriaceae bacterium]
MDDAEKEKVRDAILEKIEELEERLKSLIEATKPMGLDSAIGRVSRMDYINNKTIDEANIRSSESKLISLKRWIDLFGTEKFGKCSRCGAEINVNRLLFLPESTRCIHCAGK